MFDNVVPSDQFIASSRPSSPLPFPFPFHLHAAAAAPPPPPAFASFDPYPPHHQTLHHLLLPPPPPPPSKSDAVAKEFHRTPILSPGLASEWVTTAGPEPARPWSNEEVLALLKIRSGMEIWFPDFTWEHVSRKLAEVGYKRSAEKCKERFEEESRNLSFNKSLRFFTELDDDDDDDDNELYHHQHTDHHHHHHQNPHYINLSSHHHHHHHKNLTHDDDDDDDDHDHEEDPPIPVQHDEEEDKNICSHSRSPEEGEEIVVDHNNMSHTIENEEVAFVTRKESTNATTSSNGINSNYNNDDNDDGHDADDDDDEEVERMMKKKNAKRKERFEMFKGMCERIVERIMGQQEELHNKILEDMVKMEEVKIARDDARKREEMDRLNREIEAREKEQVIASDRHAKMIEFLNKLSSSSSSSSSSTAHSICRTGKFHDDLFDAMTNASISCEKMGFSSPSPLIPLPPDDDRVVKDSGPAPSSPERKKSRPSNATTQNGDVGKRWPREEVLALINLRSSVNNNGGSSDDNTNNNNNNNNNNDPKDGAKGPLWERISLGMQELGYSRSAKRCKEKWENINKYFRKTKDSKKKRPLDSRTCPYFHQLSTLYCGGGGGGGRGDLGEAFPETALQG